MRYDDEFIILVAYSKMPMTGAERNRKYHEAHKDRINEARRLVRKVPKQLPRECPCCGKTFIYFSAHMRKKHPDL